MENGVLQSSSENVALVGSTAVALTFEQQKELLLLQTERDTLGIVQKEECDLEIDLHVVGTLSISQQEPSSEQRSDTSLSELFDQMQPSAQAKNAAFEYSLQSELLVCKRVPHGFDCLADLAV